MELELNQTPVRTSKNFNINNVMLKNIVFPNSYSKYMDFQIINNDSKVSINEDTSPINITYGLGGELTKLVKEKANNKLNINIDSKTNKEIFINYDFLKNNSLIEDIEITATDNSKETVIIKYETEKEVFHNGIIRINAKNNSYLNIIVVNLLSNGSNNFLAIQSNIGENARVKFTSVDFGGKNSIINYYSNMLGNSCQNNIYGIYLGNENQTLDLNYIAELRGEKSNVKIDIQGALLDIAKKHFKGTIDFKKGCKKSVGDENESCMLLSDTAKSISLPMLLCSEEDVEGNHSSSSGKIDEKELFYIMTRGFSEIEATKLMVKAKFNKILDNISNQKLKEDILKNIDIRLH